MKPSTLRTAASLALAAWLSFAVAASLHVHNAYWAAMPVWVLAQATRGLVVERAVYRLLGTLVGAAAGFALLQLPITPLGHLVVLASWVALHAGLTHVLRGVLAYAALLAGMTAAIVVIPSVLDAAESIELALARVECTLIGVVVSTLVLALLTPASPLAMMYAHLRHAAADALASAARTLRGVVGDAPAADASTDERRILGLFSQLESGARLTSAGSIEGYRRIGDVDRLVVGSLSAMAAAQAASAAGPAVALSLSAHLDAISAYLREERPRTAAPPPRELTRGDDPALLRLQAAVDSILDADRAMRATDAPETAAVPRSAPDAARLAPHREWRLAWRTGALAGAASLTAAALALAVPWPPLQLAAMGVCIFVVVLGSLPTPQPVAPGLLAGVVVGVAAALCYRLAVQPAITTTPGLLLSLVPFLVLGGLARASERFWMPAIDANMCFLLVSQAGMPAPANATAVFADAGALVLAAAVVAGGFLLLPRRAPWQAADAATTIRRDLLRILEGAAATDPVRFQARVSRQILRLSLHLGRAPELAARWPGGMLAALNLGHAIIELQRHGMPETARAPLAACLRARTTAAATAPTLAALAATADDVPLRDRLASVATTLSAAAAVLDFAMPAVRRPDQVPPDLPT